jgi:hypothetical protein
MYRQAFKRARITRQIQALGKGKSQCAAASRVSMDPDKARAHEDVLIALSIPIGDGDGCRVKMRTVRAMFSGSLHHNGLGFCAHALTECEPGHADDACAAAILERNSP